MLVEKVLVCAAISQQTYDTSTVGLFNHHSGSCTLTLGISVMEFCHVIKIIPAQSNSDMELFNTTNILL